MKLLFLFVYATSKTMHWKRDFLQGIRWLRFRRLIMMSSCPFLVLSVLMFCVTPDYTLMLKNCLSTFNIWSCNEFLGMFVIKMNVIASNYDEHKKLYSVIIVMLKNNLTHDALCPMSEKLFEQIQNLKFEWICRHVFDMKWIL